MIELDQILVGTLANDKTGDPLRNAFQKVNANMVTIAQHIDALEAGGGEGGSDFPDGTQVLIRDTRDVIETTGALHVFGGVQIDKNAYVQESVFIGTGSNVSELTAPVIIARRDGVQFIQSAIINTSAFGSADYAAYADTGNDTEGFADMGFTGSDFNDPNYTFTGPGDGYFIVIGLDDGVSHGEMHLATGEYGTTKDIVFSTGGFSVENEVMRYIHADQVFNISNDLRVNGELQTLKLVGMGDGSGDGNGYSTIELIPDSDLYANGQYLIIDPTAPSHIHIRAGGPQDSSPADLFLGGENNYVRVNDSIGLRLQTVYTADDYHYYDTSEFGFSAGSWYTADGANYVEFTTTNPIMVNHFWDFTNGAPNQLILYVGEASFTLDYGGSGSSLGENVYRVQVVQAPPEGGTVVPSVLEFHIFTSTTNSVQLENNDFRVEVGDDIRMYSRDVFRLYNYSPNTPIQITTDWDNSEHTWSFGADGNLQLPYNGDIVDSDGNSVFTKKITTVNTSTPTTITTNVVFGDPNAAGGAINLVLPSSPANGTVITVKNINSGGNSVFVATNGEDSMENESGSVGTNVYATLSTTGQFITWVFDSVTSTYRIIG